MQIYITNLQNLVRIDKKKISRFAEFVLKRAGEDAVELSLLFVDDPYIKKLNRRYRKINSSTDVLAFPMREGIRLSEDSPILGDVVVSIETAKREAKRRNICVQKEIHLYVAHGILHLLGYDDARASDRKKMRAKEKELLAWRVAG